MRRGVDAKCQDVAVLVRVSDIHTSDISTIQLFVDPWSLFDSNEITVEDGWLIRASLEEKDSEPMRKRRKVNTLSMPWNSAPSQTSGRHTRSLTAQIGQRPREKYVYKTLDSDYIRLLYLLPGSQADKLRGVISQTHYLLASPFRALSYVWGSNQLTEELITPDGVLQLTSSLHKALLHLRNRDKGILLWADAICIDQGNDTEKAHQIRLLPEIFQVASSTCAFLDGDEKTEAAVEALMQMRYKDAANAKLRPKPGIHPQSDGINLDNAGAENEADLEHGTDDERSTTTGDDTEADNESETEDWPDDLAPIPESWNDSSVPPLGDDIWTSIRSLFDLPWFRRVWIVQEVVAAPVVNIICGKWVIDWDDSTLR